MPKSHPPYAPEFRRQMVELVRSGRTPEELSREFEPTAQAIWNWVRQAERDAGRRDDGLPEAERAELARLRRENSHGLVNNAGIYQPAALMETDDALWQRHIQINQYGCFLGMKAVVPAMERSGGGSIVNIS